MKLIPRYSFSASIYKENKILWVSSVFFILEKCFRPILNFWILHDSSSKRNIPVLTEILSLCQTCWAWSRCPTTAHTAAWMTCWKSRRSFPPCQRKWRRHCWRTALTLPWPTTWAAAATMRSWWCHKHLCVSNGLMEQASILTCFSLFQNKVEETIKAFSPAAEEFYTYSRFLWGRWKSVNQGSAEWFKKKKKVKINPFICRLQQKNSFLLQSVIFTLMFVCREDGGLRCCHFCFGSFSF